jgi:hypothetical protein
MVNYFIKKMKLIIIIGFMLLLHNKMEVLKDLTPEQIHALSPECLQILLNNMNGDIAELKYICENVKYSSQWNSLLWENSELNRVGEILLKNKEINFYFLYLGEKGEPKLWKVYTEDEIKKIVPNNVNLNKICFSQGKRPLTCINYPNHYSGSNHINNSCHIEGRAHLYDNLFFVHSTLLDVARHLHG